MGANDLAPVPSVARRRLRWRYSMSVGLNTMHATCMRSRRRIAAISVDFVHQAFAMRELPTVATRWLRRHARDLTSTSQSRCRIPIYRRIEVIEPNQVCPATAPVTLRRCHDVSTNLARKSSRI